MTMDSSGNTFNNNMARPVRHHRSLSRQTSGKFDLLALPWDILEPIFSYVFRVEGGYVFDSTSEKLVTSSGSPINLSLMYTCRSIWEDTKDMPLSLNNITFSTLYTPEWRPWAGRFCHLCNYHRLLQTDLLFHLRAEITPDMCSEVDRRFPSVMPKLREELDLEYRWRGVGNCQHAPPGRLPGLAPEYKCYRWRINRWEGIDRIPRIFPCATWVKDPHTCKQAIEYTLKLIARAQRGKFALLIKMALPRWPHSMSLGGFLDISLDSWDIPPRDKLEVLGYLFQDENQWAGLLDWPKRDPVNDPENYPLDSDYVGYQEKYRFSATAVAIWFIRKLSLRQRLSLKKVTLVEDKLSVNRPAIHGTGLIPLCQENPDLRIQRHLVLSQALQSFRPNSWGESDFDDQWNGRRRLLGPDRQKWVSPLCLTGDLLLWIAEASRLPSLGMPANSYTLVLDGGHHGAYFSDLTQNVFLEFCAAALAYHKCRVFNIGLHLPEPSYVWLSLPTHWARALSVPIRLYSEFGHPKQVPLIQSNFDFGTLPNVSRRFQNCAGWNNDRWFWARDFCFRMWTAPYPPAFGRWQDNVLDNYERQPIQDNTEREATKRGKLNSTR